MVCIPTQHDVVVNCYMSAKLTNIPAADYINHLLRKKVAGFRFKFSPRLRYLEIGLASLKVHTFAVI